MSIQPYHHRYQPGGSEFSQYPPGCHIPGRHEEPSNPLADSHELFDSPIQYSEPGESSYDHTQHILSMFDNYLKGLSRNDFRIVHDHIERIMYEARRHPRS
jgi:hypothetical protein